MKKATSGRYAEGLTESQKERYERLLQDEDFRNLKPEMAMLALRIEEVFPNVSPKTLAYMVDTLGKLAIRQEEIAVGRKYVFTVEEATVLQNRIAEIVLSNVDRCPHCGQPLDEIRARIAEELAALPEQKMLAPPDK